MAHTVDRVETWIERQGKKGVVAAIEIHRSTTGQVVDRCVNEQGREPADFAQEIFERMEEDADSNEPGQAGKYMLSLFFQGEEEAPPMTLTMSVMGSAGGEAPSMEDQFTGQALRHQEVNMVTAMHGPELALSEMRSMLTMVVGQNKELMAQRMEELLQMRKIILDQQEIEIAREKAKAEAFLWGKVVEQAEMLVPMVVGQLMKKKPEEGQPEEPELEGMLEVKILMGFYMTLDLDQQEKIGAILEPVQRIALMTIMKDPSTPGAVDPIIIPILAGRIVNAITFDQKADIEKLLTTDEQRKAWEAVYRMRKLTLGWQKDEYMLTEKNKEEAAAAELKNGTS
jgi:hypothetical protein